MGKGFWYGDKEGGHTYGGEITDLTIDETGKAIFRYTYSTGGNGVGIFAGKLTGNYLGGLWDEKLSGAYRFGNTAMWREQPAKLSHRFKGQYTLVAPAPSHPDDIGVWVIEFDSVDLAAERFTDIPGRSRMHG